MIKRKENHLIFIIRKKIEKSFSKEIAPLIYSNITDVFEYLNDKELLEKLSKLVLKLKKKPKFALKISFEFKRLASKKNKELFQNILSLSEKYDEEELERILSSISDISDIDIQTAKVSADVIKTYKENPQIVPLIVSEIENLIESGQKKAASEFAKDIKKYVTKPEIAKIISLALEKSPKSLKDEIIEVINSSREVTKDSIINFIKTAKKVNGFELENLAKEKASLENKTKILKYYLLLKQNKIAISPPSTQKTYLNYLKSKTIDFLRSNGLEKEFSLALLEIKNPEKDLYKTLNKVNRKRFPLNKVYITVNITKLKPKTSSLKVISIFLSDKLKTKEKAGLELFEPEKIKHLKEFLNSDEIKRKISTILKEEKVLEFAVEEILSLLENNEDVEISNIASFIKSIDTTEDFKKFVIKTENPSVKDLFSNYSLNSSHFYPSGKNRQLSLNYLSDPEICLLKIIPIKNHTLLNQIGIAILIKCKDNENRSVLLVDAVEGGYNLLRIAKKDWQEALFESIKSLAKDMQIEYVIFNENVKNLVPKMFISYLKNSKKLPRKEIFLEKIEEKNLFERIFNKNSFFLKSFGNNKGKGIVKGYILKIRED